ncbi:unnamed protein product, partial [Ectocarpus sp. 8 AP-2014]
PRVSASRISDLRAARSFALDGDSSTSLPPGPSALQYPPTPLSRPPVTPPPTASRPPPLPLVTAEAIDSGESGSSTAAIPNLAAVAEAAAVAAAAPPTAAAAAGDSTFAGPSGAPAVADGNGWPGNPPAAHSPLPKNGSPAAVVVLVAADRRRCVWRGVFSSSPPLGARAEAGWVDTAEGGKRAAATVAATLPSSPLPTPSSCSWGFVALRLPTLDPPRTPSRPSRLPPPPPK